MKLTKTQLREIIREELQSLNEDSESNYRMAYYDVSNGFENLEILLKKDGNKDKSFVKMVKDGLKLRDNLYNYIKDNYTTRGFMKHGR